MTRGCDGRDAPEPTDAELGGREFVLADGEQFVGAQGFESGLEDIDHRHRMGEGYLRFSPPVCPKGSLRPPRRTPVPVGYGLSFGSAFSSPV